MLWMAPYLSHEWETGTSSPVPRPGEVHIWRWQLEQPRAGIDKLCDYLDDAELKRAERFHFCRDRERFIVAHGVLRVILGGYLGMPPAHLQFLYRPFGKPELDPQACLSPLSFNVSHSGGLALLAITAAARVGIDVENVRRDLACEEIAARFFSPCEIAMLDRLPSEMRAEAFFHGWTRKEAYVKARGDGLSYPLDRFTVSLDPGNAQLLEVAEDPQDQEQWYLHSLVPGPGYVAALAVEQPVSVVRLWDVRQYMLTPV